MSQKIVIYLIVVQQLVQKMLKAVIIKNIKNVNNQKVRKSRVFLIVHRTKLLKNNFGHKQNYNLNMQVRKLVLKIWNLTCLLQVN